MSLHVALLDGYVAHYRLPFFAALRAELESLTLIACRFPDGMHQTVRDLGISTLQLGQTQLPRTWRHPAGFSQPEPLDIPRGVVSALRNTRPDVVVSGDMGVRSGAAALYCRSADVPLVLWARLSEHSERGRSRLQRLVRPRLARRATRIIVNGASGRAYIESLGVAPESVSVVPQSFTPAAVSATHRSTGISRPVHLMAVGRIVTGKGISQLLRAWAMLPQGAWRLTMVGDGAARPELERIASMWGLPVTFTGSCPPEQVAAHLGTADFLIHPSLSDEWGQVIVEALASGVPVIGSIYAEAVNELIRDGVNGWRFRPDDPDDARRVLERARDISDAEWATMSNAAMATTARLGPECVAHEFASVLRGAYSARAHPGRRTSR